MDAGSIPSGSSPPFRSWPSTAPTAKPAWRGSSTARNGSPPRIRWPPGWKNRVCAWSGTRSAMSGGISTAATASGPSWPPARTSTVKTPAAVSTARSASSRESRGGGAAGAPRAAAADDRGRLAGRGGSVAIPDRELLGIAGDRRADYPGGAKAAARLRRRDDGGGHARCGTRSRPHRGSASRRHRDIRRAAHRAGSLPRARGRPGRHRGADHRLPPISDHVGGFGQPRRHHADGSAARPDGRRGRDHQRRDRHGAPHGPPLRNDRRPGHRFPERAGRDPASGRLHGRRAIAGPGATRAAAGPARGADRRGGATARSDGHLPHRQRPATGGVRSRTWSPPLPPRPRRLECRRYG